MATNIRQRALEKIAALSAATPTTFDKSDLDRLCRACPGLDKLADGGNGHSSRKHPSLSRVPMTIREFHVLIALCRAAPLVRTSQSAQKLTRQLLPYLLESHLQQFAPSPFFRHVEPSPTETLSFHLTAALLSLGSRFGDVQEAVSDNVWTFLNACTRTTQGVAPTQVEEVDFAHDGSEDEAEDDNHPVLADAIRTVTVAVSFLGFLDAASAQADFWQSGGRLALIQRLRTMLSERFLVAVETALSTIRNTHSQDRQTKEWKRYLRHYSETGRPLGAMLLQRSFSLLLVATSSLLLTDASILKDHHILDLLLSENSSLRPVSPGSADANFRSVELYASAAADQVAYLDANADFVHLGALSQQKLAYSVKASALVTYLNGSILNEEAADVEMLMNWLEEILADPAQMADDDLAFVVLRAMALISKFYPSYSPNISRLLPRFMVQSAPRGNIVAIASECLAFVLKNLSQDAVISTLYTLGNVLSPGNESSFGTSANGDAGWNGPTTSPIYAGRQSTGSSISLQIHGEEETSVVYGNVVQAICGIASACGDDKITALAQSMLLQKIDKISDSVDASIIMGAAALALEGGQLEFRSLLKMCARLCHVSVTENRDFLLGAVTKARNYISANIRRDSPLYDIYWEHLLDSIISTGDVHQSGHFKEADLELAAREIAQLLQPLAVFMSAHDLAFNSDVEDESHSMLRDAWFNIVVHGFTLSTAHGKKYANELRTMAIHSPPLVAEQRGEQVESDIELNTILRRGMSSERESLQKKHLAELVPSKASEIRSLSYRKAIFLQAAYLVESLRAGSGDCTKALSYFLEPSMRRGEVSSIMEGITAAVMDKYLKKTVNTVGSAFSAQYTASQLAIIFCSCCHRIRRVQQAAFHCADRIIRDIPSSLCHRSSLFALLELLSLMWSSCLEAETDLYQPRSSFTSTRANVTVQLSDDYSFRRETLDNIHRKAKAWVLMALDLAPADIKGLLQTYLSEFDDEGAYGHISLGRSFALEIGASVPSTNHRLSALGRLGNANINTASDFIAQYTTRQEYRYGEALPEQSTEWLSFLHSSRRDSFLQLPDKDSGDAATALAHVEARLLSNKMTTLVEVRDILRRAAALLCRSQRDECAVAHYLVSIPFAMFTKHSINLGVSLWLGVMNENPRLEPRILIEIAQQWESSIQKRLGLFNPIITHPDPFFQKEEFAPSDGEALAKRRQLVHNLLAPHTRLLQFFNSHFNATRMGSQDTQRTFLRMLDVTLDAVITATSHPLAREIRLQIILFGLKVLDSSTTIGAIAEWRLKDKILSAALSWFTHAPRWSFGSNVMQLKTEIRLLSDVVGLVNAVHPIGLNSVSGSIKSLQAKEQLLLILLENEQARLSVWVHPLNEPAKAQAAMQHATKAAVESALPNLVRTAWVEDPSLAVELATRFQSTRVLREVRWLLLNFPEKAVSEPEALTVLLGGAMPDDVSFQLKYLLFWSAVNPITAVTFFLPAFKNHAFLIQYAMRALEHHSVDITFFYVPQIVQTLRYDALGYVERYILETAQFSQLFAHQIIWNMKANAYKDDDAQIPDEIKPTLDEVMERMVDGFSLADRAFYEKEFVFFDEVTDISGKLKPLIKRPKPEKKQKIEEELRKIKVEVGVYLPSNPDGVVIGIDRKSGKPLQSHAKAPFMATFRIKRQSNGLGAMAEMLEESQKAAEENADRVEKEDKNMVEVWQSAIFKVGDDCRQDVLALQMIAAFRGIFHSVGLDVYVFPYRVTATAPGCGVIDVLPNSISRDMLGREAVNGLYDYFISKYGNEDSLRFQHARNNFVKSMAAYSIISFLLQFKDRHNGNIMIDDAGHILHIDFGFCFDIAPGGIKFERAPFKLTNEMVSVMGGTTEHQAFQWFEELCVKAFLASRPYAEKLSQIVLLMMGSGLPCFKPESVKHFKERFVLEKSEREAADFMKDLIKKSYASVSTGVYDQFQLMTNGIPY